MHEGIPEVIRPVLEDYRQSMADRLPGFTEAFYVCGSIALGSFNDKFSDIDFVAIVSHRAMEHELLCLRDIHQEIGRTYPKWKLEGSYLQWNDLGQAQGDVAPYPCYHDGRLHLQGYHDLNPVTWWVLKNRGIAVMGSAPEELAFTVDWNSLIRWMYENLNTYWVSWTRKPMRVAYLGTDDGIQWAVLGILRQFYTFRENDITSKTGAGRYALSCMPAKWHRLIQEAIRIREQGGPSHYRLRLVRAVEAVRFLKYVGRSCNTGRIQ